MQLSQSIGTFLLIFFAVGMRFFSKEIGQPKSKNGLPYQLVKMLFVFSLSTLRRILLPNIFPDVPLIAFGSSTCIYLLIIYRYAAADDIALADVYFLYSRCCIFSFFHSCHLIYIFLLFFMTIPLLGNSLSLLPYMSKIASGSLCVPMLPMPVLFP